jgi:CRISPR-associated protein Cas2
MPALYLIAYDIADPRRLRRVARFWERHGLRRQRSVFLVRAEGHELRRLLEDAGRLIRPDEDRLQAWRLAGGQPADGHALGAPRPPLPAAVVLAADQCFFLDGGQVFGEPYCRPEGLT